MSPDRDVAWWFARSRAHGNGQEPVLLLVELDTQQVTKVTLDSNGWPAAALREVVRQFSQQRNIGDY